LGQAGEQGSDQRASREAFVNGKVVQKTPGLEGGLGVFLVDQVVAWSTSQRKESNEELFRTVITLKKGTEQIVTVGFREGHKEFDNRLIA
jgi:hypothetical protein